MSSKEEGRLREKTGNYRSMNGARNFPFLKKKSFIYVDSLLVMYLSVNPHNVRVRVCTSMFCVL